MAAGLVTVADDGTVTKSGAAGRIYDLRVVRIGALLDGGIPAGVAGVPIKRGLANDANDTAAWFVAELQTYTKARITTADVGLQRLPASLVVDEPTKAPAADKDVALVHT